MEARRRFHPLPVPRQHLDAQGQTIEVAAAAAAAVVAVAAVPPPPAAAASL